ncbi:HD-GYP domain-containing protein [Azospirillum agricola]|uniref:HD-GYP domain-containing protein n=1 Tax=Azospirillum agricola TaxID=1720247 RepID=UPI000A0F1E8D|nr:two-component system response regulator [Azospirillum agricola]SMH54291.1 putative two-component system response regulator [Azospirillum lipoferum]
MTEAEPRRPLVLVVDDTPDNLVLMAGLLKESYRVKVASGGEKALRIAQAAPAPDLILLDIMMPDMDGYAVCRRLKADPATHDIPVVFLTALSEQADEQAGLELGAVDYITKPISAPILLARVRNHIRLKEAADYIRDKNLFLEAEVARRTADMRAIQDVTILALASLAETRDNETGSHILRTQHYVRALAEELRGHPRFAAVLTDSAIDLLYKSAPLHDIGKVGIPDAILLKPGKLTPDEWEIMKTHATLGADSLARAEARLEGDTPSFLRFAREIAESHHEKWDGSGYPRGLKGDAIPVSARLMALADVYDALISKRVYKDPMSHEQAAGIILEGRGRHFDPDVTDAFLRLAGRFQEIAARYVE